MKNLFFLILALCLSAEAFSQQKTIAKFKVTKLNIDGKDYTREALQQDIRFVLYESSGSQYAALYANSSSYDYQLYGPVSSFTGTSYEETADRHAFEEYNFVWEVKDTKESSYLGISTVKIVKVYVGSSIKVSGTITFDDGSTISLKGYMLR
jgi:hypothetical protein